MLGYILRPQGAEAATVDRLLDALAQRLERDGIALGGGVQRDHDPERPGCAGGMSLRLLGSGEERLISQTLGTQSESCHLDAGALELAVEAMARHLSGARLVILNKFGKQEVAGRGVRPLIADAMAFGLPVLLSVDPDAIEAFHAFAGDMAEPVAAEASETWCRDALAAA